MRRAMFLTLYALVWLQQGSQMAWAVPIVVWGLVTAFSRCLMGRHFLGDVLAGLLVGVLTTAVVTQVWTMRSCPPFRLFLHGAAFYLQCCRGVVRPERADGYL